MAGIVVGIDGSANSERALAWAVREAAIQHSPLTVLTVHHAVASELTGNPVSYQEDQPELETVRKWANELTQKTLGQLGEKQPASVSVRVLHGFPAKELIDASADADLMVVGSRGLGGFARLLMGSVSSQVAQHATCPVVVVPHER